MLAADAFSAVQEAMPTTSTTEGAFYETEEVKAVTKRYLFLFFHNFFFNFSLKLFLNNFYKLFLKWDVQLWGFGSLF
jgi:hypothetical protein